MSHDSPDPHAEAPAQGIFIGWLAVGLLGLMVVFTLAVLIAAATHGFS